MKSNQHGRQKYQNLYYYYLMLLGFDSIFHFVAVGMGLLFAPKS